MDFSAVEHNLRARGFSVRTFSGAAEASAYLNEAIDGQTVGFGGSVTLDAMGLFESLGRHNTVAWHWKQEAAGALKAAAEAQVYVASANALAETGEIVNIDGVGNRVAGMLYGHRKVYLVVGRNKLAKDYDAAVWRARNVAAPKNAQRLKRRTPCAQAGDRCYDCKGPDRICRGLVVLWAPMSGVETEVVLIDEDLGY